MKDIKGFESFYSITKEGKIWSKRKEKFMKTYIASKYECVDLYKNNKKYKKLVHRLVAETYIENPLNLEQVDHIDNNKLNNSVENLQWITQRDNLLKSFKVKSNVRNFKECELWNKDGFVKTFKSISECCRYCRDELDLSYSSMEKYRKCRDYIIKV